MPAVTKSNHGEDFASIGDNPGAIFVVDNTVDDDHADDVVDEIKIRK